MPQGGPRELPLIELRPHPQLTSPPTSFSLAVH